MIKVLGNTQGSLKWLVIACMFAVTLGVGFIGFNQWATTQDKYVAQANADVAQANAETLAKDISSICQTEGRFVLNNRDLCDKGEDVLANPTAPIPGAKGDKGDRGADGKDGEPGIVGQDGAPGKDGVDGLPGTNGVDGIPGTNGLNGADGLNGTNGTDGLNGTNGTNGTDGTNGADGKDGQSVTYFSWTDQNNGKKYNCYPEPAGSSTFTCTAENPNPIPSN